ncbi:TIM44-like domain-containing protein [Patulibacter sp.]|uniref:TIM44-like domain-containing protein n=1 Tax=Patulibacter sp. TaxID=1912859 RepID=UPI0027290F76|nr:TIM44-like domain-containing protein [Patulibacter sp.]MDO9408594.1 TIM44-like domain-containing protein [Patulibacter sp.]
MPVLASVMTHPLVAQAGSGSSGFSGGGGGGGGGGFSGGSGGSSGSGGEGGVWLFVVFLIAMAGLAVFGLTRASVLRRRRRRGHAERDREARSGAVVAAEDDPDFDAEALVATGADLVVAVQTAWDARDREALGRLIGGDLLDEWVRRLDDFDEKGWHNRVVLTGDPDIRLITLVNRLEDADDRVVLHVELPMDAWVDSPEGKKYATGRRGPSTILSEYWTMAKHGDDWRLVSIEGDEEGGHHLTSENILDPAEDPELAAESRTEIATDGAPSGSVAGLASTSFADDAHAAALDLSLVDDRWSPDVLQIAVDRAVAAWATAVDGPDDDLERLADPEAARRLLHGPDETGRTRTVVRGPQVDEVTVVAVTDAGERGQMSVRLRYRARWYREDRATAAVVEGSKDDERERTDAWTFALTEDREHPWRLVAVG